MVRTGGYSSCRALSFSHNGGNDWYVSHYSLKSSRSFVIFFKKILSYRYNTRFIILGDHELGANHVLNRLRTLFDVHRERGLVLPIFFFFVVPFVVVKRPVFSATTQEASSSSRSIVSPPPSPYPWPRTSSSSRTFSVASLFPLVVSLSTIDD